MERKQRSGGQSDGGVGDSQQERKRQRGDQEARASVHWDKLAEQGRTAPRSTENLREASGLKNPVGPDTAQLAPHTFHGIVTSNCRSAKLAAYTCGLGTPAQY